MMTSGYVVAETNTTGLSSTDRAAYWREHVRLNHGGLDFEFDREASFTGSTIVQRSGDHQLVEFWSDPISYIRTSRHAHCDDDRSLRVFLPRSGTVVVEGPKSSINVAPGRAAIASMTSAFALRHDETARAWVLTIPEGAWPSALAPAEPRALDLRFGMGAIIRGMVRDLSEQRSFLTEPDFTDISERISELVGTCASREATGRLSHVENAARDFVRLRADDPSLTPSTLAGHLGWSLRQLQTALNESGTSPAALIRSARLARAWFRLRAPGYDTVRISDIAYESGFSSLSGFNSAFREKFGMSPREARARKAPATPKP